MPTTLQGQPIDQRTAHLALPLVHIDNWHEDDVPRLRAAMELLDAAMELMGLDVATRDAAMAARVASLEWAGARPSGISYGYDAEGRVQTVTYTVGGQQRTSTITYDDQGRMATVAYPVASGATRTETYHYDSASGDITGMTATEGAAP